MENKNQTKSGGRRLSLVWEAVVQEETIRVKGKGGPLELIRGKECWGCHRLLGIIIFPMLPGKFLGQDWQ